MTMKKTVWLLGLLLIFPLLTSAYAVPITWSAYLPFDITTYSTTLQSSQPWYFSMFSLSSSRLTFYHTYLGSGNPITALTVSSVDGNLTFNQLSLTGETSFTVTANGNTTISLTGYGMAPDNAELGNASLPFTYISSNDTLVLAPTVVGSQDVTLNYPTSSTLNAMAIAIIALIMGLSIGSVALVFALRNNREKEDSHD